MTNKYFNSVSTLEELRKQYKELLKQYHPDNNGDVTIMQEINAEYDILFKLLKDKHNRSETESNDNKSDYNNMKYDFEEDIKLRNILNKIIKFSDITIEVCGSWIWVAGNTYQYRKEFKELGFKWASQKHQWYWHSEAFQKKSRKTLSMNEIRNYYGSTEVETTKQKRLETA